MTTTNSRISTALVAVAILTGCADQVPIATTCNGVDGAVLVTTPGEVTVSLVQEGDTAIRYSGEGMSAETADVTIEQVGASTLYRATVSSDAVPAVDVALEINDTSPRAACPS